MTSELCRMEWSHVVSEDRSLWKCGRIIFVSVSLSVMSCVPGCGGALPPPPGNTSSQPTVSPPVVSPPPMRAPAPASGTPLPKPVAVDKPTQLTATASSTVILWQSPVEPILRSWEQETVQHRDREKFEVATKRLRERLADDRDALIDLTEREAKLWRDVFSDRARQIESLKALREQFARQAYDDAVRTGWNALEIGKFFEILGRRRDAFLVYAAILKIPLDFEPFFLAPSRSDDGYALNYSRALQHAVEVGRTEELPSLDPLPFAAGYIHRFYPHLEPKMKNMRPSDADRDFKRKTDDFFRALMKKIPPQHPAREHALKLMRMDR